MNLFTKSIKNKLIANHKEHKKCWNDEHPSYKEFKAVLKLFNPTGIGTWYLSEYDQESKIAFGVADLGDPEMGSFALWELEQLKLFRSVQSWLRKRSKLLSSKSNLLQNGRKTRRNSSNSRTHSKKTCSPVRVRRPRSPSS